jgi:hypothetical protein
MHETPVDYLPDRFSRETDREDSQLSPRIFTYLDSLSGLHSIDRLATQGNTLITRYNARSRDPTAEAVECPHLPDRHMDLGDQLMQPTLDAPS